MQPSETNRNEASIFSAKTLLTDGIPETKRNEPTNIQQYLALTDTIKDTTRFTYEIYQVIPTSKAKSKATILNTFPKITAVGSIDKSITTMSSVRSCEITLHPEYLGLGAVVIPHQLRSSFNTLCIEEELAGIS